MGVVIYYLQEEVTQCETLKKCKVFFMVAGNLFLLISMALSGLSHDNRRIQLLCIFFGVLLNVISDGWIQLGSNRVTDFLAKYSMVLYIMHWTMGVVVNGLLNRFGIQLKMIAYYGATLISCVIILCIVERVKSGHIRPR